MTCRSSLVEAEYEYWLGQCAHNIWTHNHLSSIFNKMAASKGKTSVKTLKIHLWSLILIFEGCILHGQLEHLFMLDDFKFVTYCWWQVGIPWSQWILLFLYLIQMNTILEYMIHIPVWHMPKDGMLFVDTSRMLLKRDSKQNRLDQITWDREGNSTDFVWSENCWYNRFHT